jgi:hypothetical protein
LEKIQILKETLTKVSLRESIFSLEGSVAGWIPSKIGAESIIGLKSWKKKYLKGAAIKHASRIVRRQ